MDRGNTIFLIRSKALSWALPLIWSLIYLCCFRSEWNFWKPNLQSCFPVNFLTLQRAPWPLLIHVLSYAHEIAVHEFDFILAVRSTGRPANLNMLKQWQKQHIYIGKCNQFSDTGPMCSALQLTNTPHGAVIGQLMYKVTGLSLLETLSIVFLDFLIRFCKLTLLW